MVDMEMVIAVVVVPQEGCRIYSSTADCDSGHVVCEHTSSIKE